MNRLNHRRVSSIILAAAALAVASMVSAMPQDRQAPINVQSDSAVRTADEVVYQGNVIIQQGSLQIKADHVVVKANDSKIRRMIATGKRAYFEQVPQLGDDPIQAWANTIEYRLSQDRVVLIKKAEVLQSGSTVAGDQIVYSMTDQSVRAKADSSGRGGRVHMVLQPEAPQQQ